MSLIVIALLGALAIGLLATIDPFEQLKKGRDTATRNTVTEFYNANLRYYGTKGEFPWGTGNGNRQSVVKLNAATAGLIVTQLVDAGELKANFTAVAGNIRLGRIYLTSTADDQMSVCFQPESKNFRLDTNTIFNTDGLTTGHLAGTCSPTNDTTCFWCIN